MCRERAVACNHRPAVLKPFNLIASHIYHRLYGKSHPRPQPDSSAPLPEIGYLRLFVKAGSNTMAYQIPHHSITVSPAAGVNCIGNAVKIIAGQGISYSLKKALPCHPNQFRRRLAYSAYRICAGSVGMISFINKTGIQTYDIPFLQNPLCRRNSMYYLIVYGNAYGSRIIIII